jgi:hypothetical protein
MPTLSTSSSPHRRPSYPASAQTRGQSDSSQLESSKESSMKGRTNLAALIDGCRYNPASPYLYRHTRPKFKSLGSRLAHREARG